MNDILIIIPIDHPCCKVTEENRSIVRSLESLSSILTAKFWKFTCSFHRTETWATVQRKPCCRMETVQYRKQSD